MEVWNGSNLGRRKHPSAQEVTDISLRPSHWGAHVGNYTENWSYVWATSVTSSLLPKKGDCMWQFLLAFAGRNTMNFAQVHGWTEQISQCPRKPMSCWRAETLTEALQRPQRWHMCSWPPNHHRFIYRSIIEVLKPLHKVLEAFRKKSDACQIFCHPINSLFTVKKLTF